MKVSSFSYKKHSGFSLLETSISLTVIALLVAAVVAGQNIKHRLELNQVIDDISAISSAVTEFQNSYGCLPGDCYNATALFGTSNTSNGNGDNDLDGTEELLFWQHLQLAGLIEGSYDGTTDGKGGRMEGPLKYSLYDAHKATGGDLNIEISKSGSFGILTPKEAYDFDSKYDDTDPTATTGTIIAADGTDDGGDCVNTTPNPDVYNLTNNSETPCILYFYLE